MHRAVLIPALLVLLPVVAAQDMVGVSWSGRVYAIDSYAGVATSIGTGLAGQNASALAPGGTFWSTHRSGPVTGPWVYHLTTVDPSTGAGTIVHSNTPDIRALANGGPASLPTTLWCIVNTTSHTTIDELHRGDTNTGNFVMVGFTGYTGIQALAWHQGTLYAWDGTDGLLTIETRTGVATDVNRAVGGVPGNAAAIQFLCSRADGKLIGGGNDLFEIDPVNGTFTNYATLGTPIDLRGAEEWLGSAQVFGTPCNGTYGPVSLSVTGPLVGGGMFVSTSNNHASGTLGALVVGLSRTSYSGRPLPVNLDPIIGTSGCSLHVSIDSALLVFAQAATPANMTVQFALPTRVGGAIVHVQHAAFEPTVPGGMSWSDAATVHIGY